MKLEHIIALAVTAPLMIFGSQGKKPPQWVKTASLFGGFAADAAGKACHVLCLAAQTPGRRIAAGHHLAEDGQPLAA